MGEYRSICEDLTKNEIPRSIIHKDFTISKEDVKKFYDTYNDYLVRGFSEFDIINKMYENILSEFVKNGSDTIPIFLYFTVLGIKYISQNGNEQLNFNDDCGQEEFDFGE